VYHQVNGGRTIVFRATRPIAAGEEAVCSYLADAPTLPFRERRRLLWDGFLISLQQQGPAQGRTEHANSNNSNKMSSSSAAHRRRVDEELVAGAPGVSADQVRVSTQTRA
jgi:hypothetical protein